MHTVIIILGPTASGKSKLGVQLAKKFHGVVISADSRQVYQGLNIGTAKITRKEMKGVPHFLLDVASPKRQYTVSHYIRDVQRVLKKIPESTPVFLVGGSPFYIDAVTKPHSFSPVPPNPKLRQRLEKKSIAQLRIILKKLDRARARNIDWNNKRRVIRAIEVASTSPLPSLPKEGRPPHQNFGVGAGVVLKIGLSVSRAELFRRIDHQIDQRLRHGMISEVQRLHRKGVSWRRLSAFGLEYREIVKMLNGQASRKNLSTRMKSVTHDFVRRQMTWWKRDQDIHWVTTPKQAEVFVSRWLQS